MPRATCALSLIPIIATTKKTPNMIALHAHSGELNGSSLITYLAAVAEETTAVDAKSRSNIAAPTSANVFEAT
jgi:hypothetical protein